MKIGEIRVMNADEIKNKLFELKKEYFNLRFQHGVGQLENTAILPAIRKDIARIKTVSKEKKFNI